VSSCSLEIELLGMVPAMDASNHGGKRMRERRG
jgi:hypothetical protein